jgi:hypothetical protein
MISGEDIVIEISSIEPSAALDSVVRCMARRWPDIVIQDGHSGNRLPGYAAVPFGHLPELFIYRDDKSFQSWAEVGASPSNTNTMVHLLVDTRWLTLVIDNPRDATMLSLISEVREILAGQHLVNLVWRYAA